LGRQIPLLVEKGVRPEAVAAVLADPVVARDDHGVRITGVEHLPYLLVDCLVDRPHRPSVALAFVKDGIGGLELDESEVGREALYEIAKRRAAHPHEIAVLGDLRVGVDVGGSLVGRVDPVVTDCLADVIEQAFGMAGGLFGCSVSWEQCPRERSWGVSHRDVHDDARFPPGVE
jgi:hypothetical protein